MAEHTKGPWTADGSRIHAGGVEVARVTTPEDLPWVDDLPDEEYHALQEECASNARLIAAAPDLLEAAAKTFAWRRQPACTPMHIARGIG